VLNGIDKLIPVDVYVPGCPPRPEALIDGTEALKERIRKFQMFGIRDTEAIVIE